MAFFHRTQFGCIGQPSNIADPMSRLSISSDLPEAIDDGKDYIGMLSVDAVPHAMSWVRYR